MDINFLADKVDGVCRWPFIYAHGEAERLVDTVYNITEEDWSPPDLIGVINVEMDRNMPHGEYECFLCDQPATLFIRRIDRDYEGLVVLNSDVKNLENVRTKWFTAWDYMR